jgi:RNA polymerase sigma-70 factor (ECF subfamily)
LPPEVRVVSVLFLINGLSYKDIALVVDCPIGTVMSRLSRGRKLLREYLSDYYPGIDRCSTTGGGRQT